jgi:hypothetical protein
MLAQYLSQPSLPEAKSGSRPICSYCKRILVYVHELPSSLALQYANVCVNDDKPIYEPNGMIPVFGLRGKRGYQIVNPFKSPKSDSNEFKSTSIHLWLTPAQYYTEAGLCSLDLSLFHGVCEVCYQECFSFFMPMYASCSKVG